MIKAVKVRLRPTKAQEIQLLKSVDFARFSYNWALARHKENQLKLVIFILNYQLHSIKLMAVISSNK